METIKWKPEPKPYYDPPNWPITKRDVYKYVVPCDVCSKKYQKSRLEFVTKVTHCNADGLVDYLEKCSVNLGQNSDFDRRNGKSWEWTVYYCPSCKHAVQYTKTY